MRGVQTSIVSADGMMASECAHLVFVYEYGPSFVAGLHALCCAMSSESDRLLIISASVIRRLRRWLAALTCTVTATPASAGPHATLQPLLSQPDRGPIDREAALDVMRRGAALHRLAL